jgi:hypothetical protein
MDEMNRDVLGSFPPEEAQHLQALLTAIAGQPLP